MIIGLLLAATWVFPVPEAPFAFDREEKDGVKPVHEVAPEEIRLGPVKLNLQGSLLTLMSRGSTLFTLKSRHLCNDGWGDLRWWESTVTADGKGVHRIHRHAADSKCDVEGGRQEGAVESDVRVMPDGSFEVTFDENDPHPKRNVNNCNLVMPVALWLDQWVSINGSRPFRIPATMHEFRMMDPPADTKAVNRTIFPAGSEIAFYKSDGKTLRFAFRAGEGFGVTSLGLWNDKEVVVMFARAGEAKRLKFALRLGDVRAPREKPHLVGGVDFGEENDFDVACWDEKRNIFVNGGFESGTRYWKRDIKIVEGDAHSGRFAATGRVRSDVAVISVGTVLKPDTWYTVGLWAKMTDGKKGAVTVAPRGAGGYEAFLKGVTLDYPDGDGWQFRQGSFRTKSFTSEAQVWISANWSKTLIDDICIVEGSNVVATAVNPWGLELKTGAEDNLFVPADRKDGKIQLAVRGPKGAKAKLDISGSDLLSRKTIAKNASVTIPDSGETLVDLGPDSAFPKGVNGIKVKLNPVRSTTTTSDYDSHPYTDYLRFNKANWCNNTHKHRYLQSDAGGAKFLQTLTADPDMYGKRLRRNVMLGLGALNYTQAPRGDGVFTDEERKLLDAAGVKDYWGALFGLRTMRNSNKNNTLSWNGKFLRDYVEYPKEMLKWIEEEAYVSATSKPWRTYWTFDTEPAGHHASLRAGRMDEYAKLMLAINRGLKRANPKNEFCPYGSYNMGMGTAEIAAALKAMSVEEPETRFKYVEVHSYREFPEDPDVQKDLDTFISRLTEVGYPDIKIKIGEGSYYFPMFRPSKGMFPWTGVATHDGYSGIVMPSYDLGFGEKIGAAMTTRETAIYYKNADRVYNNCSWNPGWIDNDTPCGWLLANVGLAEMLGDSTYLGEVRFAPKSRAMFFSDGHGALTVFMWRGDAAFDRGQVGPVEAEIDFGDIKPEFYDMYANRCVPTFDHSNNPNNRTITKLPLSGYPVYIKLPKEQIGRAKEFKRAIAETLVRADLNKLPLSCSLTLKDSKTVVVKVVNGLSRTVKAQVKVNGEDKGMVTFPGMKDTLFDVALDSPIARNVFSPVKVPLEFTYEGKVFKEDFTTSAVAVSHVKGDKPDWGSVPAVDIPIFEMWHNVGPHKTKKDFNGTVRLAWNEKHLWMRFNVNDDVFMAAKNAKDWKAWGSDSDMIHIYFDGYANGREKFKRGQTGYDFDDFAFGVYPLSKSLAKVVRTRAPDHQLTGGAGYGFVIGPEDHVKTEFAADGQGYELTLDFPAYYMKPVKLEAGGIAPGFAVEVYDRDQDRYPPRKAVKSCTGKIVEHPENWSQLILVK